MSRHIPVLLKEAVAALQIQDNGVYVDGTFGAGGYTSFILEQNPTVHVYALDRDETAISAGQALVKKYAPRLHLIHGCFGDMSELIPETVNGIVLDIGVSSMQIDTPERGFSFQKDGPLDMRMEQTGLTAADIVNTFKENELADILFQYGEEKKSRLIAKKIIERRKEKPFKTTLDLAQLIHGCMPHKEGEIDSATRTFQALRIYVNDELGELERALIASKSLLKPSGILAVVSFHSLEDRIVKRFFQEQSGHTPNTNKHLPPVQKEKPSFELLTKKPITATSEEKNANPRSRSAKLRVARRLA